MIVYFSGTGNSRYVAEQLARFLNDEVCDVFPYIRSKKRAKLYSEKPWVFVSPVYVSAPPLVFLNFLNSGTFQGSKKGYFIQTCAGGMGACSYYNKKAAEKMGLLYMGTNQVFMPQNYLIYFQTKTRKDSEQIIDKSLPTVQIIAERISRGNHLPESKLSSWEIRATKLVLPPYYKLFIKAKGFRIKGSCTGCGKCEKVCPLGNIRIQNEQPVWGNECTHCMACISYCPKKAIEYKNRTKGKVRYSCKRFR